jgi:two-component system, LytTR family, sensor kinase
MKKQSDKKPFTFYIWLGLAYLFLWLFSDLVERPDNYLWRCINNAWAITYLVAINYTLFEYAVPFIKLTWKRLLVTPILIVIYFLLYSIGFYTWRSIGINLHIYTEFRVHPSVEAGITYHFPYALMSVLFFAVIKHIYDYRVLKRSAEKLRIEKQEAELNYLKSQTNPHFLFNTLNNIYSLTLIKSDLAPEAVMRLSKILRYMLNEASGEYISIEQELKVINDYIALEKLRYDESLRVNFSHNVEDVKQSLPPLLLMPLVENAFKHGVSETRTNPFVDIHLSVQNRQLTFSIRNSSEIVQDQQVKENIGLSNLRRQLELLYKQYDLSAGYDTNGFKAVLRINLASHVKN